MLLCYEENAVQCFTSLCFSITHTTCGREQERIPVAPTHLRALESVGGRCQSRSIQPKEGGVARSRREKVVNKETVSVHDLAEVQVAVHQSEGAGGKIAFCPQWFFCWPSQTTLPDGTFSESEWKGLCIFKQTAVVAGEVGVRCEETTCVPRRLKHLLICRPEKRKRSFAMLE